MWKALVLFAAVCTAACTSVTDPRASAAGSYRLVAVDGRAIPTPAFAGTLRVDSGTAQLLANGRYSIHLSVTHILPTAPPAGNDVNEAGTWTAIGGSLTFTPPIGAPPYAGIFFSDTLTLETTDTLTLIRQ